MNKKISRILRTNITLFSLCLVAFVIAAIPVSPVLALAEAVVVVLVFLLSRRNSASAQQSVRQYMQRFSGGMDSARSANMLYAPMGMVVFDFDSKAILWANDRFLELAGKDLTLVLEGNFTAASLTEAELLGIVTDNLDELVSIARLTAPEEFSSLTDDQLAQFLLQAEKPGSKVCGKMEQGILQFYS